MIESGYADSIDNAFSTILSEERGYYVRPKRLSALKTVEFIKDIGASATLAHPYLNLSDELLLKFLSEAKPMGLDAMETLYSEYDSETEIKAEKTRVAFDLLPSGGSDFHGDRKPHIKLGRGRGNLFIPKSFADALRERSNYDK